LELLPQVHLLSSLGFVNAYLLVGDKLALVDTGMAGQAGKVLGYVARLGHQPQDLTQIFITHYHLDHAGSLAALKAATGATVYASPADAAVISGQTPQPLPQGWRRWVVWLEDRLLPVRPCPVDKLLNDGDAVPIPGLGELRAVASPGHTPGHLCYYLPERRLLFTGDALINTKELAGANPQFSLDMVQARAAVRKLAALDVDVLCFSHGPPIVSGAGEQLRALAARL
jgi:glyoxylase-like metal-dependent hydrolase (beta-lactamase superfamily II)